MLVPLREALEGAPGPALADVGGGTGNYAVALANEGWEPLVIDRSEAMLTVAAAKGLATLKADAASLPVADASFDAVAMISVLHHLDDPSAAFSEADRILRPGGRLAVAVFSREDVDDLWLIDYFPVSRSWMDETHSPLAEMTALLPGSVRTEIVFADLDDASIAALASHPELVLDPEWRRQTSYFERMERDHPEELADGLERLCEDVGAGRGPERPGRASLIAWKKD